MSRFVELGEGDNFDIELSEIQAVVFPVEGEEVTIEPTTEEQVVLPTSDKKLIKKATVKAVTSEIDENIKPENIVLGKTILGVQGNVAPDKPDQTKTTIPNDERQVVRADVGYELLENIVEPIPVYENELTHQDESIAKLEEEISTLPDAPDLSNATATANDIVVGKTAYTGEGMITGTLVDRLQWKCDNMKTLKDEFSGYTGDNLNILEGLDTSDVTSMYQTFYNCSNITTIPLLNTSNVTNMSTMFRGCKNLLSVPNLNLSSVDNAGYMFYDCEKLTEIPFDIVNIGTINSMFYGCRALTTAPTMDLSKPTSLDDLFNLCKKLPEVHFINAGSNIKRIARTFYYCEELTTIPPIDMLNITQASTAFDGCRKLTNLTLKNIKIALRIGSGTSWGHLLTDESLINTAKELWDLTGSTSQTLTVSTPSNARFDAIYVKLITATDEMIAEDQYINNKKPCVVCESTDDGAMTLREYVVSKNWSVARG